MIDHEVWRVVASGGLTLLLNKLQSISSIDTRARLLEQRDVLRWLRVELAAPTSLAFALSEAALGQLWDEIQASAYYEPTLRAQDPPLPQDAAVVDGTTLSAAAPATGYTLHVYAFDGLTFTELGPLSEHAAPGAGNYVLAVKDDTTGVVGLPSLFLTIS
jgi:hypothetical protein